MSEKNKKKAPEQPKPSKPDAEENIFIDAAERVMGRENDEFEKKYHRAVAKSAMPANHLLNDLSRESSADKYNFIGAFIPIVLIIILAMSFIFISRGDIEELLLTKPSVKTVFDGSYTKNLNSVYESTLPFSGQIKKIGALLGFCDKPAEPDGTASDAVPPQNPEQDMPGNLPAADDVIVPEVTTSPAVSTEPVTTTTPCTTEEVTTAATSETEPEVYDTYTMYANATLNVRFGPSTEDAILGYYNQNDPVEVIEIMDNGWAAVLFDGHKAYAHSNYLSEKKVRKSRTEATTTEEAITEETIGETEATDAMQSDEDLTASPEDEFSVTEEARTDEALPGDDSSYD